MTKAENGYRLVARLQALADKARKQAAPSTTVGYMQHYALPVHENLQAHHTPPTQAKFLEQPAREKQQEIAALVRNGIKNGLTLEQSLLLGALYLLEESKKLVPVDTGALKESGFACLTKDAERVGNAAYARSEALRQTVAQARKVR